MALPQPVPQRRQECVRDLAGIATDRAFARAASGNSVPASLPGNHDARSRTFARVFDLMPAPAFLGNTVGDLLAVNTAWRELFGDAPVDGLSLWFVDAVHPDDRAEALIGLRRLVGSYAPQVFEHRYRTITGRYLWLRWNTVISMGEHGCREIVAVAHDVTETHREHDHLEFLAQRDALTGLPGRDLFRELVSAALHFAARHRRRGALLFCDLDDFKRINDTHGHQVGDRVLICVADRIRRSIRSLDHAGRLGGDEFGILLDDLGVDAAARAVAQRLLDDIGSSIDAGDTEVHVTASIGVVVFPDQGSTISGLLRSADAAMYAAKNAGGNRVARLGASTETS